MGSGGDQERPTIHKAMGNEEDRESSRNTDGRKKKGNYEENARLESTVDLLDSLRGKGLTFRPKYEYAQDRRPV